MNERIEEIVNFRRISNTLTTSGQPTEAQIRRLADEGCQVVINLALHNDPSYSLPDERGLVEGLGMVYVHIPVIWQTPTAQNLMYFFLAMDQHQGSKVHLHCAANMRVTAFLGLYRLLNQGMAEQQAFQPMHSVWEPNDTWSTFISSMITKRTGK